MALDWLYPKKCVGCDKRGKYFCDECVEKVGLEQKISQVDDLSGLVSLFEYRGLMKRGVKKLKYKRLKAMEEELDELMKSRLRMIGKRGTSEWKEFVESKPIVVPVPLHKRRENWRGFNQAEVLAKLVAKNLDLGVASCLKRIKNTKQQAGLSRQDRLKNVSKVFEVVKGKGCGKNVLVVDDVWTTGSTMRVVVKELKKNGAKEVWGLVLAQANF